ncbi:MAG TPA: SLC13 family permease [Anaerolineae bacterium]
MFGQLNPQQVTLLSILLGAFILLVTERIRIDLTAILLVVALTITRVLEPEEALSGFSSEPAIVVAAIFVLSGALFTTGLSDKLGSWIGRLAGRGYNRILPVTMLSVASLSAFTHHVTITAVMLPITLKLCREQDISPSKLLMPMSFAASLGTTITIIGAPAFLIADGVLRQVGRPGLSIFSIAPIGIALSIAGTLFMLFIGRFLLPEREGDTDSGDRFRLDSYYTELLILVNSPLIGRTVEEIEAGDTPRFKVVSWLRRGRYRRRPFAQKQLREGDVLLVRTSPEEIAGIQQEPGLALHPVAKYDEGETLARDNDEEVSERLVQAVVAPGSDLIGRTIGKVDFLQQYGVLVVGLWRRKGWMRTELSRVKLREGDVLVLLGDEDSFRQVADDRSFLMLVPFKGEPRLRHKAALAGIIMIGTVLVASLNILPIEIALLAGAATMVLMRCITVPQAYQSIDTRIFVFIAGAIPLGLAIEKTGLSDLLADSLQQVIGSWNPLLILLVLFVTAALITQVMSDAATTALLAPMSVALARALGQPPEPYVITVAMAAVASFLTPIGHHGNLLIYGPGRYQFSDFLRTGTPLTLIVAVVVTLLALALWPG